MRRGLYPSLLLASLACGPGGVSEGEHETRASDTSGDGDGDTTGDGDSDTTGDGDGDTSGESEDTGDGDEPPPCQELHVDLAITDDTDPASVSCVWRVNNLLSIENTSLTELSLLPSLEIVGRMRVAGNSELLDFSGLEQLREVDSLSVYGNPKLQDLSALVGLERVDSLYLVDPVEQLGLPAGLDIDSLVIGGTSHTDLSLLEGFSPAPPEGSFSFGLDSTPVTSLAGLYECCGALSLSVDLVHTPQLTDLSGLEQFTSLDHVRLYQTYALTSLEGLDAAQIAWLQVEGSHCSPEDQPWSLPDLTGLNPEASIDRLELIAVHSLESLDALVPSLSVDNLSIYNNTALPQAIAESAEQALAPAGSFVCGNGGERYCFPLPTGPCPQ